MTCLRQKATLRLARHVGGNHWHAILPRTRIATSHGLDARLDGANVRDRARAWLQRYDRWVDERRRGLPPDD